jgi:peroxiredoxin Q/BCP
MGKLDVGNKAPAFEARDQNGKNVRFSDFTGKKMFLYFYPKANTSG